MCVYANVCLLRTIKEEERNRMRNTEEAREGHEKGTEKRNEARNEEIDFDTIYWHKKSI